MHRFADWLCNRVRLPQADFVVSTLAKALLPPLVGPLRCPTIYGFDLQVRRGDGENYYRKGFYEPGTLHVIRQCLRSGDTFVDGGASVGLMTLFAARCVGPTGRVLAFEPHPDRYEDLCAGIGFGSFSNVIPLRNGLGDEAATLELYESVSPSMIDRTGRMVAEVSVQTLDSVLARERIDAVRMLKLDIEGFEGRALKGAIGLLGGESPPIVCFEHGVFADREDPLAVLEGVGAGYAWFQLSRTKSHASDLRRVERSRLRRHDNVFAIPEALISELPSALVRP